MNELLAVGSVAPGFELRGSDGRTYRLGEMLAQSRVVLLFYPGNDTPG